MIFVDTHTHLYSDAFDDDRNIIIEKAISCGVKYLFLPAIDSSCHLQMRELKQLFPENIFLMMGLHPTYVKENWKAEMAIIENELNQNSYVAVGEIGIDLYWDKSNLQAQQDAFVHQIQLAKKHQLPINIHCRDAFDAVLEILQQEKSEKLKGIFHCFTGNYEQAKEAIDCNMLLGIGGVVTFKNGKIDQFLHQIPLDKIVLETDAPYLAPNPYRGKRNESAYIIEIATKLTTIYQKTIEEIASCTTQNALMLYKLSKK
jgi:TatD DNase family protein